MAKAARVEAARIVFAEVTGALEDASLVAAEGQTALYLAAARQTCVRLLAQIDACTVQLHRLRRRLR